MSKLLDLMLRELGPPPVKFCLLLMGSEGRREQTGFQKEMEHLGIGDQVIG